MIIGLYSRAPRMGKGEIAKALAKYDFVKLPMAGCIKGMIEYMLRYSGMDEEEVQKRCYDDDMKDEVIPYLGVSCRDMQRTLGAEWGRQIVNPKIWITLWKMAADKLLQQYRGVVCDDVRFPNEGVLIKSLGGEMWSVYREDKMIHTNHASDDAFPLDYPFDHTFYNNGTVPELHDVVDIFMAQRGITALPTKNEEHG